jgi:signal transduction histidine kinase
LAVVAGRLAMDPWWGRQHNRHLLFLPLAMIVAWFWGLGPALVSAALSAMAISYFWMEPRHQLFHVSLDLGLFVVMAAVIAGLTHSLRRAGTRADAAAKAREQVLAIVAHDLRNPLTTIQMNAEVLKKTVAAQGEPPARSVAIIQRCANRMETLIKDLVDATRLAQGGVELALHEEAVDSIVNETVEAFAARAREKGLQLEAKAPATTVRCDRNRILQVLGNLLGNALKFTPQGGKISLHVEEQPGQVRFEVKDTGPGIRTGDLPHLFDRYWRADPGGTGLGLFIAQSLVRAQGGKIEVESRPGLGARFFFSLPRTA